ncbi:hypothetical protein KDK_02060 [Dictyobacter kobayashii]|uniref:histidine kinase n=1 Tax=Dictyobacter kobayashii TaxID=2014872 RepID=A0A402ABD4_9CHLR|nr:GAF domain-containing protein [Dictyobacter kobayashii]GCE16406.1 hypothetical protein KDK_02060 [Dictyobacter kobayashii]
MRSESPLSTNSQEHNRLRKALRESELLRELSELLASSLDPTRILQVLVRRATEVCDVSRCAVWLLDDTCTQFLPSAYHMSTQNLKSKVFQAADRVWHHSSIAFNNPVIQQLLQAQGLLSLKDLSAEVTLLPLAEKFFVRSILLVALIREDRPVGMMSLDNPGKCTEFTDDQLQLARAIGQQAAVAIDNARLYQEAQIERRRAERLIERAQSIYQVAMTVNSSDKLSEVLDIAAEHLARGLHTDQAAIALIEADQLKLVNQHMLPLASSTPSSKLTAFSNCCQTIKQQTPMFIYHEQLTHEELSWFNYLGMGNILIIPLLVGGTHYQTSQELEQQPCPKKHCVGFAFVDYHHHSKPPSSGYIAFAQDIAAHCALAIEKAYHLAEAQRAEALANERANTLNAVFNAMTEGLIVCDAQGKVMLSNENAAYFLGLKHKSKKQLATYLQHHPLHTLAGQPLAPEQFPLTRALRGERIRGERYLDKAGDGSEQAIEVNIEPLLDNEQKKIGIVSAFRDITEQVRVERRIRRALDTMLHAAEAVSGVTNIKEILYRVLAMTLTALNCERGVVQIYQDEQQSFLPLLSIGFTEDEVKVWLSEQANWFAPDGNQSPGLHEQLKEGHATLINEEQLDKHSTLVKHTLVLATPITHNKHLLGMMLLDRSTHYKTPAHQTPRATRPLPVLEFNAWDMAVIEGIAQFAGLAIEQTHWQQEAEIARINEATMRESNELKDEFLAITAHEFRTPLTIILAHSQMMSRLLGRAVEVAPELKERLNESISYIEEQTRQLTNIVNTFLEVTRLNRGQIELNPEEIDMAELIKELVLNHSATSTIHEISYTIKKAHRAYIVKGIAHAYSKFLLICCRMRSNIVHRVALLRLRWHNAALIINTPQLRLRSLITVLEFLCRHNNIFLSVFIVPLISAIARLVESALASM